MAEQTRRLSEQVTRKYPHAAIRRLSEITRLSEPLALDYSQQERIRRVSASVRATYPPAKIQRIIEEVARSYSARQMAQASEQVTRGVTQQSIRRIAQQMESIAQVQRFDRYTSAAVLASAARRFEQEAEAGDLPQSGDGPSLGGWLATRPLVVQVGLLYAGLQVLDAFSKLLEEATGEDIPDTLQAATAVCFAMIGFLLIWFSERDKRA